MEDTWLTRNLDTLETKPSSRSYTSTAWILVCSTRLSLSSYLRYGESDPDPNRSPRRITLDIEELADGLGLGPNF
ncbi:unnamed protein product [Eruca vesicaria subsp. sativa]|uniref:Uncharacterized protein n=1 Tax=Eruca vesicaria subsp. sativa TaxID=29727 RepID=A0ABC8J318_ERUVS|nr:unnamed protein product [Eruca vesicaria subsp. sativa]